MSSVGGKQRVRSKRYNGRNRRQSIKNRLCHKNEHLQLQLRQAIADKEAQLVIISDLKRSEEFSVHTSLSMPTLISPKNIHFY